MKIFNIIPVDFILGIITASFFWAGAYFILRWQQQESDKEIAEGLDDVHQAVKTIAEGIKKSTEEMQNRDKDN